MESYHGWKNAGQVRMSGVANIVQAAVPAVVWPAVAKEIQVQDQAKTTALLSGHGRQTAPSL